MGGVAIMMIRAISQGGGWTAMEKRRAPKAKSSWSATGRGEPGGMSNRLLIKE